VCVFAICTAKKDLFPSLLCLCLSFTRSSPFFLRCRVSATAAVLLCVSLLSFSPFVVACVVVFFFSLSLTLSCDRLYDPSSLIGKCWCVSRVSDGCQRLTEVTPTAFSYLSTVTFRSSQSLRRRVGTLIKI
jgi:hypothetical protein